MIKLNLKANNKQEEAILAYIQENASETLAEKSNNVTQYEKDGNPLTNLAKWQGVTSICKRNSLANKKYSKSSTIVGTSI